ncbi:hypothetical protein ACD591_14165 [Rufibacter glacialis]|uniref:Preprotein translocase subunit SecB n=1 Tax=Rufibacter glacialis TaxID=1259555 RepID=A0A5M8Q597_9BACT|nr:hypothetical protein [Rufibacter glacialis]KAA6431009.1 hypothetical protein FOE74_18060 [Rufibacter glacialis]GGK83272.1 hypothetical protein GCM10011405_33910 [Rufibacter glacialis]
MTTATRPIIDFSKVILTEASFIEFSIKNLKPTDNRDNTVVSFNSKVITRHTFNVEEKGIKVEIEVTGQGVNQANEPAGAEATFHIGFTYFIENFEEYLIHFNDSEEAIPSPVIMIPLVGAAYSTARGMIIIKAQGTAFEGFSLPIVNAQSLITPPESLVKKKKAPKKSKKDTTSN